MELLEKNKNSKFAYSTIPTIIAILKDYEKRLTELELFNKDEIIEEIKKVEVSTQTIEPVFVVDEVKLTYLNAEMLKLNNQEYAIDKDIKSLEDLEVSEDDVISVCTDISKQVIETTPDLIKCGSWKVDDHTCNDCIKVQAKSYTKAKKQIEKERSAQLKLIKSKQKQLIKEEQKQLELKLKNIKKNRNENYGLNEDRQTMMKEEIKRISDEYSKTGKVNSTFNISMFV